MASSNFQEEEENRNRLIRAETENSKWQEKQKSREIVLECVMREIIAKVITASSKCFDMECMKNELTRIKRVRRGEELRKELFVRLKREQDRVSEIESREKMRDWKMCESEVWECVEGAIQESERVLRELQERELHQVKERRD